MPHCRLSGSANAPCFSGRSSIPHQTFSNTHGERHDVTFLKRQGWRKRSLQYMQAGAGGLLSIPDFGRDRDVIQSQQRDALRNGVGKGRDALKAAAHRWKFPFSRENGLDKTHKEEGLPMSLFAPYKELPTDGRTMTEEEETCNPEERNCQTPMHVWESKCRACYGTGSTSSYGRRGKRSSATCPSCTGMGYVRRTSSRIMPNLNGQHMTIGRPILEEEYEEYIESTRNGKNY